MCVDPEARRTRWIPRLSQSLKSNCWSYWQHGFVMPLQLPTEKVTKTTEAHVYPLHLSERHMRLQQSMHTSSEEPQHRFLSSPLAPHVCPDVSCSSPSCLVIKYTDKNCSLGKSKIVSPSVPGYSRVGKSRQKFKV